MSHYKPYPAYKQISIEWIDKVPEHWTVDPFKRHIERNDSGVWGDEPSGVNDTIVLRSTEQTVDGQWIIDQPALRQLSESDKQSALLKNGDLVVTKSSGSSRHIGKTTLVTDEVAKLKCSYSNFMQRLRTRPTILPKLAWYVMNSGMAREQLDLLSNSTTGLANLNGSMIGQLIVAVPPLTQQRSVVEGLDRETARIDALIEKKTRFVELLKEKRQALITHAVTKGLDPNVKMKDSGLEWIGEVPAHWTLMKFGRIARVTEGLVDPRIEPYRSMPLFAPNHVESGTGRLLAVESAVEQDAESGKYLCKAGCVVYSKIRPALSKVIVAPTDGLCSADMYPLTCTDRARPRWLFYLMLAQAFTAWAVLESDRVAMPKINRESLADLVVAVPPVFEQDSIVSSIEAHLPRVDALIQRVNSSIALLKERRAALITAAVTGQIDLRQEAA